MRSLARPQWRRISRQTNALLQKNFLVFYKSPLTTLARALIFPLLVTLILSFVRSINSDQSTHIPDGIAATPTRVPDLADAITNSGSHKLVFVRNGISNETLGPIISGISSLPGMQHIQTHSTDNPADIYDLCRQSIEGFSDCFAAVVFTAYDDSNVNYTIALDPGITNGYSTGNFVADNSVTVTHLLPLQWALDSHIGNFTTAPRPFLNPYSGVFGPHADPLADSRGLSNSFWLSTVATFTGPLFILILIGITYHLSTFVATERESSMAELMAAQTVTTVPRILSTITSFFALYLPGLIACSVILTRVLFVHTNDGVLLLLTILAGASMTVSSHFLASFFSKAQLAGLYTSVLTFALALVTLSTTLSNIQNKTPQLLPLALIFPPMTWVFMIVEVANVEYNVKGFSLLSALYPSVGVVSGAAASSTDGKLQVLDGYMYALFFLIQVTVYGFGTYAIEQRLWGVTRTFDRIEASSDIAVRCTSLSKTFTATRPWYWPFKAKAAPLVAVDHLNLEVKRGSVTFLLGPNGGGKTTTLKCIAGMTSMDAGSRLELNEAGVVFGICPQNNVLWENLTVEENIRIWRKLKTAAFEDLTVDEDDVLAECDLIGKAKATAKTLSGGQMRKLQLAISFVGGSKVCCIDEASSGLDPLSRRNIWNIIQKGHSRRTILVTTHFLDEADVLADHIAIVYKGKLVCEGPGTSLKARFGDDYVIRSVADAGGDTMVWRTSNSAEATRKILELEALSEDTTYDVVFPTLEQVFLKVTSDTAILERGGDGIVGTEEETTDVIDEKIFALEQDEARDIDLETGRSIGLLRQVYALLAKRYTLLLQKASWIAYGINLLIPTIIAAALYTFIHTKAPHLQTCQMNTDILRNASYSLDTSESALFPIPGLEPSIPSSDNISPALYAVVPVGNYTTVLGPASEWAGALQESVYLSSLSGLQVVGSYDYAVTSDGSAPSSANQTELLLDTRLFVNSTADLVTSISDVAGSGFAGFGIYAPTPETAVLYYDTSSGMMFINLQAFSLITNRIGNSLSNGKARAITASVRSMTHVESNVDFRSMPIATLLILAFIAAASIAVIYPTFEKINRVRALHYCNGVSPFALWVAYVLFDTQFIIIQALLVWGLLFTGSVTNVWYEPGYLLGAFILFGIATYLGTYVLSLFVRKAAFAIAAGVHMVLFVLYLAAYIMNQSFGSAALRDENYSLLQFGLGLSSPAANLGRALFVATNSFDVLCGKYGDASVANGFAYVRYGGVYANLMIQIIFLVTVLSVYEYGSADWIRRHITHRGVPSRLHYIVDSSAPPATAPIASPTYAEKTTTTTPAPPPLLTVSSVTKHFGPTFATTNISFTIAPNSTLALLGGNGAGKTTMINMIRGELVPDHGEIFVDGVSVLKNPRRARLRMGVCPQDDAVDNLSVEQTLGFYARVKGVRKGSNDVERVMEALNIGMYRAVMVRALSGGTRRKLSVAIALLGNPPILLLDEPSTGQDAGAKRILWRTLQSIRGNRAILLTTHSMEEAEALADHVAIMGTRMLATGTLGELQVGYGGGYCVRGISVHAGGEERLGEGREAEVVERRIKNAFEQEGLSVREYVDRYGQVEFKLVHDRAMLGRIMAVMEGLKGNPVGEGNEGGAGAAGGSSSAAGGASGGKAGRANERVLQDYTVTGPTLEEVFMNVAREAGVGGGEDGGV